MLSKLLFQIKQRIVRPGLVVSELSNMSPW